MHSSMSSANKKWFSGESRVDEVGWLSGLPGNPTVVGVEGSIAALDRAAALGLCKNTTFLRPTHPSICFQRTRKNWSHSVMQCASDPEGISPTTSSPGRGAANTRTSAWPSACLSTTGAPTLQFVARTHRCHGAMPGNIFGTCSVEASNVCSGAASAGWSNTLLAGMCGIADASTVTVSNFAATWSQIRADARAIAATLTLTVSVP
mmetsp:Transcript_88261/g.248505  ORF Transcript_88261/g.248505 Transcript_88261/m.248505 type:complete len:206 (+) Transcript_88261:781-1398(+)